MTRVARSSTARAVSETATRQVSFAQAREVASRLGTPLVVLDPKAVERRLGRISAALPEFVLQHNVCEGGEESILRALRRRGCHVCISSSSDADAALDAGFSAEQCLHVHPCKTTQQIATAAGRGVRWFTYDSRYELPRLLAAAPDARLLLRIAAAADEDGTGLAAKFGAAADEAIFLIGAARELGLDVQGLALHGAGITRRETMVDALDTARGIWDQATELGCRLKLLDLGDPIPECMLDSDRSFATFCQSLRGALADAFSDTGARVLLAPSRFLMSGVATLIAKVIGKTIRDRATWYLLDVSEEQLRGYRFGAARALRVEQTQRPRFPSIVASADCHRPGILLPEEALPDLRVGELVMIPGVDATLASRTQLPRCTIASMSESAESDARDVPLRGAA